MSQVDADSNNNALESRLEKHYINEDVDFNYNFELREPEVYKFVRGLLFLKYGKTRFIFARRL